MAGYTNVAKPTSSTYTLVTSEGRRIYDDTSITYDDPNQYYDGYNPAAYTNIAKPISSTYTNVPKPSFATDATSPGTGSDDSAVGTITWINPNNITLNDSAAAVANLTVNTTSHYLKASNFGFAIPTNSTIVGIYVEIERRAGAGVGTIVDNQVKIVKGGVVGTTNKADTVTIWPTPVDIYYTYGSETDLWGETWTASDINASNFGVVLAAKESGSGSVAARCDHMRITIYYR